MTLSFSAGTTAMSIANIITRNQTALSKSMQRLASGVKVSSAADGAANMAISVSLDSTVRGLGVGDSNIQEGQSMLNTADSAMQTIYGHIQNIKDIAIAASNSTTTTSQFAAYQAQVVAEVAAINSTAANVKYDSNVLLDGTVAGGAAFNIQFGPNSGDAVDIKTAFKDNTATTLGLTSTLASAANAATVLTNANTAMDALNSNMGILAGFQSRLTDLSDTVNVMQTNVAASLSRIRDTDVAAETSNMTKLQVLQQAGAYALAQANTQPSLALTLLH